MDTPLMIVAALSLVALPLAARLLVAVQRGWRPRLPGANAAAQSQPSLRVVARVQLSPQHSLHLVETGGRSLLVACSPTGTRLLQRTRRAAPDFEREAPPLVAHARAR